jgi:hypothetical protein
LLIILFFIDNITSYIKNNKNVFYLSSLRSRPWSWSCYQKIENISTDSIIYSSKIKGRSLNCFLISIKKIKKRGRRSNNKITCFKKIQNWGWSCYWKCFKKIQSLSLACCFKSCTRWLLQKTQSLSGCREDFIKILIISILLSLIFCFI